MNDTTKMIDQNSSSVQAHLTILQNVIQRMAANSSSCKAWCVTLVAAILVIVADKGKPEYAWLAVFPTLMFLSLDSYYLALEKGFRNSYNEFICKVHDETLQVNDFYSVKPTGKMLSLESEALKSRAIAGFYPPLFVLIFITKLIAF